ncbi:vanadium-dependent haloperoxidase [Piscinibacter sakaiensis]|uniref:vanadium-dependent haloperoxidase n=1 Tax=Piscinibacter sakaiensis TaxID=1547922 RepID=UPI003AAE0258
MPDDNWVLHWNETAINTSGLDHASATPEQFGPLRTSRALAITQIAVADALASIYGSYQPFIFDGGSVPAASAKAAAARASYDCLSVLYPAQQRRLLAILEAELARLADGDAKASGLALGAASARVVLDARANDGSELSLPTAPSSYLSSAEPGRWRPDPLNPEQQVLGAEWKRVVPFVVPTAAVFRAPPPPALTSQAYADAFDDVKQFGGDGIITPTVRTPEQTHSALFWAYDGTPSLCAPARMYNQILASIVREKNLPLDQIARLLAIANVALADTGIVVWESKFFYDYWRPVTAIREADPGSGPTGKGDGNPATAGDAGWTPLGSPASNLSRADFTPPFPSYPSGHAGFGGATFQTLRNYFGTDDVPFTFVSDEFNGTTRDSAGRIRPHWPRSFASLSAAEQENAQSRIYLGVHFSFDKQPAIEQGNQVANHVMSRIYRARSAAA